MANQQILLEQILRKFIEHLILRPQPIGRRNARHARHLMHIHERPTPREPGPSPSIEEHHPWHDTDVVLPPVPQLVPPFAADDLVRVDLVDGPEIAVVFVEEDGLEDVVLVVDGGFVGAVVLPELVLVVGAVEGHFDLLHVFRVGVRVVHGSVTRGFAVLTGLLVFGEGDLVFLLFVLGAGAEVGVEAGFVVGFEVFAVGVGDGDIVEEFGAAEDEVLAPARGFAEDGFRVVGEDAEDHVVVGLCG